MQFKFFLFISVLVLLPVDSWAETHTAASCSLLDVTAAYNSAYAGDIVVIPAGNGSWSSALTITKSITLQGAGSGSTTITNSGTNRIIEIDLASDVAVRITDIYFDNVINTGDIKIAIHVNGKKDGSFALTKIRIDNNTFNKGKRSVYMTGWVYGVIANNTFVNCDIAVGITGDDNHSWNRPIEAGTANALFIEDNTFIMNNNTDIGGLNEQIYHQEGGRTVTRYNTFDGTAATDYNSLFYDSHGNQNYYQGGSDFRGQPIIEVYNNTFAAHHTYRFFHIRGGSALIYNNALTQETGSGIPIRLTDEESWQTAFFNPLWTEWNAEDQIMNSFFWNNTINGNPINAISLGNANDAVFIQKDRDYFMHAPEAAGGKSIYTGRVGGEESFSATGVNAYYPYTPYTYPHPLAPEEEGLLPPQKLRINTY